MCVVGRSEAAGRGYSKRVNTAHLPGAAILLEFLRGKTFLFIAHYETEYKIHMQFKYKLQICEEISACSWPFWATTSSHPPPARGHVRCFMDREVPCGWRSSMAERETKVWPEPKIAGPHLQLFA